MKIHLQQKEIIVSQLIILWTYLFSDIDDVSGFQLQFVLIDGLVLEQHFALPLLGLCKEVSWKKTSEVKYPTTSSQLKVFLVYFEGRLFVRAPLKWPDWFLELQRRGTKDRKGWHEGGKKKKYICIFKKKKNLKRHRKEQ